MGTLFVVGTPIGHLEDISPRALRVLRQVNLIASENPPRTQRLLARYEIETPMMRFTDAYDRKKAARTGAVVAALHAGDVALVSEAGMPGLADPGYELIQAVLDEGLPIVPVPGPTAMSTALAVSGLPAERFLFLGFLPRKRGARRELLALVADSPCTLVAYESPHRLIAALEDVAHVLGSRPVAAAGELTKMYEEVRRGTAADLLALFEKEGPRGEYTLVIGPPREEEESS
ncbi:MAG: 16S rRNA (cytidine(1402)-2'-O)-methyltransferase [Anaerolineae bacterium]|nr:16S rRNA (cytidine(1402)-2'-O)-methyltransferase [Anaerolineae bacterium]